MTTDSVTQPPDTGQLSDDPAIFWASKLSGKNFPPHIVDGLIGYVANGVPPGSFLTAMLENDLVGIDRHADDASRACFWTLLNWIVWTAPAARWGNKNKVAGWMLQRQAELKAL